MTCLPVAYLYERGGQTIWPPAIVHGLIGCWQLFEPTYPASFSGVVILASIVIPLTAFALGDGYFQTSGQVTKDGRWRQGLGRKHSGIAAEGREEELRCAAGGSIAPRGDLAQ